MVVVEGSGNHEEIAVRPAQRRTERICVEPGHVVVAVVVPLPREMSLVVHPEAGYLDPQGSNRIGIHRRRGDIEKVVDAVITQFRVLRDKVSDRRCRFLGLLVRNDCEACFDKAQIEYDEDRKNEGEFDRSRAAAILPQPG
nr:hypothetical protein [Pararhizobium mangrovi]